MADEPNIPNQPTPIPVVQTPAVPPVQVVNMPAGQQGIQGIPGVPGSMGIQSVLASYMNTTAMVVIAVLFTWLLMVAMPSERKRNDDQLRQFRIEFDADVAKLQARDDARMSKLWERHTELVKAVGELTTEIKRMKPKAE